MAIPWLIGGAIVAVAAAAAAVVSDDDNTSKPSSKDVRDEERRQEKQRKRKESEAKKEHFQAYAERVTHNLAKKYGGEDSQALLKKLEDRFRLSVIDKKYETNKDSDLLASTKYFQRYRNDVASMKSQLVELQKAVSRLEALDDEFRQ